jgi:hypothetical protein
MWSKVGGLDLMIFVMGITGIGRIWVWGFPLEYIEKYNKYIN